MLSFTSKSLLTSIIPVCRPKRKLILKRKRKKGGLQIVFVVFIFTLHTIHDKELCVSYHPCHCATRSAGRQQLVCCARNYVINTSLSLLYQYDVFYCGEVFWQCIAKRRCIVYPNYDVPLFSSSQANRPSSSHVMRLQENPAAPTYMCTELNHNQRRLRALCTIRGKPIEPSSPKWARCDLVARNLEQIQTPWHISAFNWEGEKKIERIKREREKWVSCRVNNEILAKLSLSRYKNVYNKKYSNWEMHA